MNKQIMAYVILIQKGKITIENVAEDYMEEVSKKLNEINGIRWCQYI